MIIDTNHRTTAKLPSLSEKGVTAILRYYARFTKQNEKRLIRSEAEAIASPTAQPGADWPPVPASPPQPNPKLTEKLFGRFNFKLAPEPDNPEHIDILDNWVDDNIVSLHIPQLDNCLFAQGNTFVVRAVGTIACISSRRRSSRSCSPNGRRRS